MTKSIVVIVVARTGLFLTVIPPSNLLRSGSKSDSRHDDREATAMPAYRSHRTTQGTQNAAARALWRATGTAEQDLNEPIIAIANSFAQFVPGHVHLKDLGHISPEAAEGGLIALVENGDQVEINIPDRSLQLNVDSQEIERCHQVMNAHEDGGWKAQNRDRKVSRALRAYAALARSAAHGAVRDPGLVDGQK